MKLAIIGSRNFLDCFLLEKSIKRYYSADNSWSAGPGMGGAEPSPFIIDEIISGGAKGADDLAGRFAKRHNIKLTEFLPDWGKHGKAAGFIRNEDIIKAADEVLCFWDGISKGSANSLSIAKRLKKPTIIIYF